MDPALGIRRTNPRTISPRASLLILGVISIFSQGCVFDKWFQPEHGIQPIERPLSQTALIEHLNQNIRNLHSWSCTDATIATKPSKYLPVKLTLNANISVEREKNFRLRARSPFGDEADFGSNSERFWFWMRRNQPPYVFTARHEDLEAVSKRLPIPFHPTWIMEALGVIPLDPNSITVQQPGMEPNTMLLVSEETSPSGDVVRREIVVDTHLGVILAHRLFDSTGAKLAEARLSRHRREPSGIIMPHRIDLDWPQHEMAMTVDLNTIEINPSDLPSRTWELPDNPDSPVFDMGRRLEHVENLAPHAPAGERTIGSQTYLEPPPFADSSPEPAGQPTNHAPIPDRTATNLEPEPPPFY